MRQFNQSFSEARASRRCAPSTLAVFHFPSGDVFVSDRPLSPYGGPTFEPLVVSWGELVSPKSGPYCFSMPECKLRLRNSGGTRLTELLESCVPESVAVGLYQWFEGLDYGDREPLGRFVISSPVVYDADHVELKLVCSMVTRNRTVGETITRDEYPGADPGEVGRTKNIVYGRASGVGCHGVAAGAATTLSSDIDASQTTGIALSMAPAETPLPVSGTLQVGRERVAYTGISGNVLTGVTRGASGTTSTPHRKGDAAFEVRLTYEYLVSGHPVRSIGDVYVGGVRVESGVTRMNDSGGNALLVFSDKFTLEKSVSLGVDEGSHEHSAALWTGSGTRTGAARWTASQNPGWSTGEHAGRAFMDTAGNYFYIKANGQNYLDLASIHGKTVAAGSYEGKIVRTLVEPFYQDTLSSYFNAPVSGDPTALCDHNWSGYCTIQVSTGYIKTTRSAPVTDKGAIVGAKLCGTYGNAVVGTGTGARSEFDGGPFAGQYVSGGGTSAQTVRTADTLTKGSGCLWSDFSGSTLKASFTGSSSSGSFWEHWVEVYYVPYGPGASPASGVALKGDSAADFVVGGPVTCDVEGHADDASGSFTGTPGALIENPADVVRHFMSGYLGVPSSEFGQSFDAARSELAGAIPGGYAFAGVINAPVDGIELVSSLSLQARLAVSHDGFMAGARVLAAAPPAARVITPSMAGSESLRVRRTGREEVINRLTILYARDLAGAQSGYLDAAATSGLYPAGGDPASVSAYGERGPERPYAFTFVRDGAMASDMRDYYITRYKDSARRVEVSLFMDNMDLEPGDTLTFGWDPPGIRLSGAVFEVEDVAIRPGGLSGGRPDEVRICAREVM